MKDYTVTVKQNSIEHSILSGALAAAAVKIQDTLALAIRTGQDPLIVESLREEARAAETLYAVVS